MSRYFDKDFFKFLFGFIAIVSVSLIIILIAEYYKDGVNIADTSVTETVTQ